ncbi:amino acid ABC transporter ATP-binding/permease protein [Salinispirillum marinum]|uniref:Amino acid ABC transporter ATP-binding/permease protein n=2 Tax=Saccharospirillaceae TaxID=255527 RepID=A0ABV8BDQ0_9GAMM
MKSLWPWITIILLRRTRLLVGGLLLALTLTAGVALLGLSGWFITSAGLASVLLASGVAVYLDVYVPGAGIRGFALTRTIARYLERLYNHDTVLRLLADLRVRLFARVSRLPVLQLNRQRSSEWLNRLTSDLDTLDNLYLRLLAPPLVAALTLTWVSVVLWWVLLNDNPSAALGVFIGLWVLLALATLLPALLGKKHSAALTELTEQVRLNSVDHLRGHAELTAAGHAATHARQISAYADALHTRQNALARVIGLVQSLVNAGLALVITAVLILGIQAYIDQSVSGPLLVMLLLGLLALNEAFANLPRSFAHLGQTIAAAQRLNHMAPDAEPPSSVIVDADTLAVSANGQSFELVPGQCGVVTGASGSGKSTLATQLAMPRLAHTAWLTQDTKVFNDTVANNLLLGAPNASDEQLWQVLEWVALADRIEQSAQGLDTWIGENGLALSGGEQRRIALARVVLRSLNPAVRWVILDEPFRGVDDTTATWIMQQLQPHWVEKGVLWLSHEAPSCVTPQFILELGG